MRIIYNKFIHKLLAITFLFFATTAVFAQNDDAINTFTPYSFYGVGDLARPGTTFNQAMGGLGTALRTSRVINFVNPAALTAQDSLSFMIDFGMESQNYYSTYASKTDGKEHRAASNSFNVHHVVLSFPVGKNFVVGAGLFPYSNVGYKMITAESRPEIIANTGNIYYRYQGEGGISQIALSLGAKIGKRLSLGAQGMYYFGTIDRYNITNFSTNSHYSNMVAGSSLKAGNFGAQLGMQYEQPLANDMSLTLGATYQFSTTIGTRVVDFAFVQTGSLTDTAQLETTTDNMMSIPQTISGGFSLKKKDVWMAGVEYVYQDWRGTSFNKSSTKEFHRFTVTPSHLIKAGFEWTPNRYDFRSYFSRCSYRLGFSYERTYMQFDDYQIKDISASLGFGLPINRWNTSINIAAEVGQRGTMQYSLIRETYMKISVSFSLYDIWFLKQRIE